MRIHFAVYTIKESHTQVSTLEGVFGLTDGGHIAEIREIYLPK